MPESVVEEKQEKRRHLTALKINYFRTETLFEETISVAVTSLK